MGRGLDRKMAQWVKVLPWRPEFESWDAGEDQIHNDYLQSGRACCGAWRAEAAGPVRISQVN